MYGVANVTTVIDHPAIGIIGHPTRYPFGIGPDPNRRATGLDRFRERPHRREINELAVILGDIVAPDRFHRQRTVAHNLPALLEWRTVIAHRLVERTTGDAKNDSTPRQMIERRNRFRGVDRIAMRHQAHRKPQQ